jgi:methylenetetrahydrofolate reductase (NADPH)
MRVTDLWKEGKKPTLSFELFPAKTEKGAANLETAIDELAALQPDFVSVTFGAGGSTRQGSRELLQKLQDEKGLEVLAYFACYGLGPDDIVDILDGYEGLGIGSVLAVRGDTPRDEGFEAHPDSLPHASDLVARIRERYGFCLGVAGYPEGHVEATSRDRDLEYLKLKVDAGADYIIANYSYDNDFFFDFVDRCRASGIEIPILPGVMPIYSVKMLGILAGICGATITDDVREGIAVLPEDDADALVDFGIDFAARQCAGLLKAGAPGVHIYTMDKSASAVGVVNSLRAEGLL